MTEEEQLEADEKQRIAALHKTAPETIWLQIDPEAEQFDGWDAQTWCSDQINDTDLQYIRADVVEALRQQLADRDEQISDLTISSDTYFAERNSARDVWRRASKDRDELRQQLAEREAQIESLKASVYGLYELEKERDTAWAQAHRLALELECLIMDTKDNAVVSKWWDSAFEAIEEYNKLKPGAAEDAEAWAKMRKAGI